MSFPLRIFETMSFVYPGFLFALSAIAIPIIIHLIQLRKYKKIYFSNISFLHSIQEQRRNTNKIKHLLVLLARILTILFLVFAFAQPYFSKDQQLASIGKNYISVYIDNSYSMDRQTKEGTLFNEAKRKAKEIALSYKPGDEFQLLSNEFSGNQQRWLNRDNFLQNLAELKIRPEVRTLADVANRQSSLLNEKKGAFTQAFVISDFQESFVSSLKQDRLDSSIRWEMVVLENSRNDNVSIDSVWFYSPLHFPSSGESLLIKIKNYSNTEVRDLPYEIIINDQVIGVGSANIDAQSFSIDTFKFKNKSVGFQSGKIKLKDQSLSFDNEYFFSYRVESSRNIAIIKGKAASNYAESVYKTEEFFQLKVFNYLQVDYTYLNICDVIILDEVDEFTTGLLSELEKQLKQSKVIISIPSSKNTTKLNDFNTRFKLAKNMPLEQLSERIAYINLNDALFTELFIGQKNTRFDLPKVSSFYPFDNSGTNPERLMKLSNEQSVLNRYAFNGGVIYQLAFPLNTSFTELPKHSLIVPMLLRMATIHHSADEIAHTIGNSNTLKLRSSTSSEKTKNELVKGDYSFIPEIRNVNGSYTMYLADQINEAGIYDYKVNNALQAKFAFNTNRKESDMSALGSNYISEKLGDEVNIWRPGDASIANIIKEESIGTRLWKICIILALFFIGLEILLIRYGDRFLTQKNSNP